MAAGRQYRRAAVRKRPLIVISRPIPRPASPTSPATVSTPAIPSADPSLARCSTSRMFSAIHSRLLSAESIPPSARTSCTSLAGAHSTRRCTRLSHLHWRESYAARAEDRFRARLHALALSQQRCRVQRQWRRLLNSHRRPRLQSPPFGHFHSSGLDRTHQIAFTPTVESPYGPHISMIALFASPLPLTGYVPQHNGGGVPGEIFRSDLSGDGTVGDMLHGHIHGHHRKIHH